MIKRKTLLRKLRPVPRNCNFCQKNVEPDFKETEILRNYLTERGKILGKDRSGVCSKHQREISKQIKRARFLALLPFTVRIR